MSVITVDPRDPEIQITPSAVAYLRKQMDRVGAAALRLSVNESGCNGYMYELDYVDRPNGTDIASQVAENLTLHVAVADLALLRGTEIDCVKEGLNAVLKFHNPNAAAECGCGESFSVRAQSSS